MLAHKWSRCTKTKHSKVSLQSRKKLTTHSPSRRCKPALVTTARWISHCSSLGKKCNRSMCSSLAGIASPWSTPNQSQMDMSSSALSARSRPSNNSLSWRRLRCLRLQKKSSESSRITSESRILCSSFKTDSHPARSRTVYTCNWSQERSRSTRFKTNSQMPERSRGNLNTCRSKQWDTGNSSSPLKSKPHQAGSAIEHAKQRQSKTSRILEV